MITAGVTAGYADPAVASVWLAVVHQVVRETGGSVVGPVEPPTVGRNHYRIRVRVHDERLRLLLNALTLLVAAADDTDPHGPATAFRDVPRPDLFIAAGLHVASTTDLEETLTEAHLAGLEKDERRDIAYHRPTRVGDVLFNWFD